MTHLLKYVSNFEIKLPNSIQCCSGAAMNISYKTEIRLFMEGFTHKNSIEAFFYAYWAGENILEFNHQEALEDIIGKGLLCGP